MQCFSFLKKCCVVFSCPNKVAKITKYVNSLRSANFKNLCVHYLKLNAWSPLFPNNSEPNRTFGK